MSVLLVKRQYGIKLVVTLDARPAKASVTPFHCVERIGVCVVADSDAVLGSGDKKNPTFL